MDREKEKVVAEGGRTKLEKKLRQRRGEERPLRHSQRLRNTQVWFVQGKEPKGRTREEREN